MLQLDTRTRAQAAFDEWADSLPIDGESGQPIVTRRDINRLVLAARSRPRLSIARLIRAARLCLMRKLFIRSSNRK